MIQNLLYRLLIGLRKLRWVREYGYVQGRISTLATPVQRRYHLALWFPYVIIMVFYFILFLYDKEWTRNLYVNKHCKVALRTPKNQFRLFWKNDYRFVRRSRLKIYTRILLGIFKILHLKILMECYRKR